mgnify:FL=1
MKAEEIRKIIEDEIIERSRMFEIAVDVQRILKKTDDLNKVLVALKNLFNNKNIHDENIIYSATHDNNTNTSIISIKVDYTFKYPMIIKLASSNGLIDMDATKSINKWFFNMGYFLHQYKKVIKNQELIDKLVKTYNNVKSEVFLYNKLCNKYIISGIVPELKIIQ